MEKKPEARPEVKEETPALKEVPPEKTENDDMEEGSYWARVQHADSGGRRSGQAQVPIPTKHQNSVDPPALDTNLVGRSAKAGDKKKNPDSKKNLIRVAMICATLGLLNVGYVVKRDYDQYHRPPKINLLAIGKDAAVVPIDIPINSFRNLDGNTIEQVIKLRQDAVAEHNILIRKYESCIASPNWNSVDVVNPYLLASVMVKAKSSTDQSMARPNSNPSSPHMCMPEQLRWYPAQRRSEVTYDLSRFARELNTERLGNSINATGMEYQIETLNAHDMHYYWCAIFDSQNQMKSSGEFSWGSVIVGTGNNRHVALSHEFSGNSRWKIEKLPTNLEVRFWSRKPADFSTTPPDMIEVIHLK